MAYKSRLASAEADLLCDAVLALQTREECYRFFDDLLSLRDLWGGRLYAGFASFGGAAGASNGIILSRAGQQIENIC